MRLPLPSFLFPLPSQQTRQHHISIPPFKNFHLPIYHTQRENVEKVIGPCSGAKAILPENGRGLWGSGALGLWGVIFFFDDCVFDLHAVMFGISFGGLIILYLCLCHVFILIQLALFLLEFLRTFHF